MSESVEETGRFWYNCQVSEWELRRYVVGEKWIFVKEEAHITSWVSGKDG